MDIYEIKVFDSKIDEQLNRASEWEDEGGTAYPAMTYEQGVAAALRWIIGDEKELPIASSPSDED